MIIGASFVVLEPELQEMIGSMRPGERRKLAEKMKRWVHQLEVSANVIEAREAPRPKPKLKWLPKEKAELN